MEISRLERRGNAKPHKFLNLYALRKMDADLSRSFRIVLTCPTEFVKTGAKMVSMEKGEPRIKAVSPPLKIILVIGWHHLFDRIKNNDFSNLSANDVYLNW